MSERGVFAVDRGIWDHPVFKAEPFTQREAWMWLVSAAAWKAQHVRAGPVRVSLSRGQLAFSLRFMAAKWRWPEPNVRRFLKRLKTDAMIDAATDTGVTVITICNYAKYQRVSLPTDAATDAEVTHQRRKEENIKDIKIDSSAQSAEHAKAEIENGRKKPTTTLPDNWTPTVAGIDKARNLGLTETEIAREAEKFRNHARQNERRAVRWDSAFDNWCINAAERLNRKPPEAPTAQPKGVEIRPGTPQWQAWRTYYRDLDTAMARSLVRLLDQKQEENRHHVLDAEWPPGDRTEAA